jgi:hypothetical protein
MRLVSWKRVRNNDVPPEIINEVRTVCVRTVCVRAVCVRAVRFRVFLEIIILRNGAIHVHVLLDIIIPLNRAVRVRGSPAKFLPEIAYVKSPYGKSIL